MTVFLIFLSISQASIFAQVKSIDFSKKSPMVYTGSSRRDTESVELKQYPSKHLNSKGVIEKKKMEINNDLGKQLIARQAAIKGPINLNSGSALGLINRYQFRRDLNKNLGIPIARAGYPCLN